MKQRKHKCGFSFTWQFDCATETNQLWPCPSSKKKLPSDRLPSALNLIAFKATNSSNDFERIPEHIFFAKELTESWAEFLIWLFRYYNVNLNEWKIIVAKLFRACRGMNSSDKQCCLFYGSPNIRSTLVFNNSLLASREKRENKEAWTTRSRLLRERFLSPFDLLSISAFTSSLGSCRSVAMVSAIFFFFFIFPLSSNAVVYSARGFALMAYFVRSRKSRGKNCQGWCILGQRISISLWQNL